MFILNPGSGVPIYRQLVEQVKRLVAGGQLRPGDSLPSVRELAGTHAVNPMTVSKAYNQLELEGVLLRRRGRPMEVAPWRDGEASIEDLLVEPLTELVRSARQLGVKLPELKVLIEKHYRDIK